MLAAANPIYGRYDDLKSAAENIDLMTTILSRFDLIFIVRDIRCDTLVVVLMVMGMCSSPLALCLFLCSSSLPF